MVGRVLLVVCDGLADRPVQQLGKRTPLEAARTPNLDELARRSICGMMHTLGRGRVPGSDVAHLAIMGYDPKVYYAGRGPIEVAGIGIKLEHGDVAFRGNFGTVDENLVIRDRRAGRIRVVEPLTKALDGLKIDDVTAVVRPGTAHRAGVVLRGEHLSSSISDADPHHAGERVRTVVATDNSQEARRTAEIVNKFLARAHEILEDHPLNKERKLEGKLLANYLLLRGAGQYKQIPPFAERYDLGACCIAGGGLYKGIGNYLGMTILDVPGATGLPDTDIHAKFRKAIEALDAFPFVFVHVKAADSLGEDGNHEGKRDFIEKIDAAAEHLHGLDERTLVVFTADHSTPCEMRQHSADPVPVMLSGDSVRVDDVAEFNERACARGGFGYVTGLEIMPEIINLLGRLPLTGA